MSGASDDVSVTIPRGASVRGPSAATRWDDLEEQALGFRPLGSRLRPPRSQVPLVRRDSLVGSLRADSRPLLLVCAPAGYGKSIALTEWVEADPRPSAWLQLDAADNDPVVLLGYLALALAQVTSAF